MRVISLGVEAIAAGYDYSLVIKHGGHVWGTGNNNFGQLGDASRTSRSEFIQVIASDVEAVAAGNYHTMVLKRDGSLWATGTNGYGQLGSGSTVGMSSFTRVVVPRDGA